MASEIEVMALRRALMKLTAAKNFVRKHSGTDCSPEQEARLWRSISRMLVPENFADDIPTEGAAMEKANG